MTGKHFVTGKRFPCHDIEELKKKKNADFSLCFRERRDIQSEIDIAKELARGVVDF